VNGSTTRGLVEEDVREALRHWEPRIKVLDVTVTAGGTEEEALYISIDYLVRSTDSRGNLVYPFYLERSPM
jgi:phage baseplate assembly protein W